MTLQPPAWLADAVFYQNFPDRLAATERIVMEAGLALPWWDLPQPPELKTRNASSDRVVTDGVLDVRFVARDGLAPKAGPA